MAETCRRQHNKVGHKTCVLTYPTPSLIVELYHYAPAGPAWPVLGWTFALQTGNTQKLTYRYNNQNDRNRSNTKTRTPSSLTEFSPHINCPSSIVSVHTLTYLLTYSLTPWFRVLLEKLTGLQLVKKFPAFYGTRRFITALTSVRHLSLSWTSPIQSTYPHPTS